MYSSFLVINVCNQGKTLCSLCITGMEDTWISGVSFLYLISWTFKNLCFDQIMIKILPHKWLLFLIGKVTSLPLFFLYDPEQGFF